MVHANIENINATKKKIEIHVPKEAVGQFRKKAFQKISSKAKINGFRQGKIPATVLEQHYGFEIQRECLNVLVDETYPKILSEHGISPIVQPDFKITPIVPGDDYHYSVEVEVKPVVTLKSYKGLTLKKSEPKVSEDEINKELANIQENLAELVPADANEKLADGLVAVMDFSGTIDGVPFDGGAAENYTLPIGKGHFLKDFETQMLGMKAGEERDLKVTFPSDYFQKDIANKTAEFYVKLNAINTKKLPLLDDELAKDVGKKDLAELKSEIEKFLLEDKKNAVRRVHGEEVRKLLLKDNQFDVPEGLVKQEAEKTGRSADEISEQIRYEFIMEEIAKQEKIEPKKEDIERRLATYAQLYRQPLEQIRKTFLTNQMLPHVLSGVMIDKALDFVIENATMV